jgi:hypothetical protein
MSKRYTESVKSRILQLYSSGLSIEQVANQVEPSKSFVAKYIKDSNYSRTNKEAASIRLTGVIGLKYGRLTAIKDLGLRNYGKSNRTFFLFGCDCGSQVELPLKQVASMKTRSCGCLIYEDRINSTNRYVYKSIKSGAKSRGLDFEISYNDFLSISSKECFYCGQIDKRNKWAYVGSSSNSSFVESVTNRKLYDSMINGLDRLDSSFGYTMDNIVSCCGTCNRAKMDLKLDDFLSHIKKIYKWRIERE